jgi:uncharacterized membrane protein
MNNKYYIAPFILFTLDIIWLSLFMKKRFNRIIKNIQNEEANYNIIYASISYIIMIIGLFIFVLPNITKENALNDSLKYGGLFGLVIYGIFDFTNLALFKNYELSTAIFDVIWGSLLYFGTAYLTFNFTKSTSDIEF